MVKFIGKAAISCLLVTAFLFVGCQSWSGSKTGPVRPQITGPAPPAAPNEPATPQPELSPAEEANPAPAPEGEKTYSWWFTRNSLHQVPISNQEVSQLLAGYQAFYALPNDRQKIYLTFDCGYELGYTSQILDVLKRQQVRSIFFLTGHYIESQPELVRRMHNEGHLVASHTYNHPDLTAVSQTILNQELTSLEQKYTAETGAELDRYLRPPNGRYSASTLKWTQELGYTTVFWSMAWADWDPNNQPGASYVHQHVLNNIHPGAVILLHVVSQSDTEALEEIIVDLKSQGYVCSTF